MYVRTLSVIANRECSGKIEETQDIFPQPQLLPYVIGKKRLCAKPKHYQCNIYTMGYPPVRGDNPRALASGLSSVQVDKHGITTLYHLHQCKPCTSRDIS